MLRRIMLERLRTAAIVAVSCPLLYVSASADTSTTGVTIWDGTKVQLNFGYESGGQTATIQLASNNRTVLPCTGSARLSIVTGETTYQAELTCGGSYALYYDEDMRRYAVRSLPNPPAAQQSGAPNPVPPTADQQAPLQELLTNRGAAAANRANLGINRIPNK